MSLINQALKKAQHDRSGTTAPPPMNTAENQRQHAHEMANADRSLKPGLIIGLVVAIAVLVGLVAGLTLALLKEQPAVPQLAATPTPQALKPASASAETPALPVPSATAPQLSTPPIATISSKTSPSSDTLEELRLAREAAEAKARTEAEVARKAEEAREAAELAARKAAEQQAAIAKADPSEEIIQWLGQSTINGVRLSESGSKVLLNGRSYGVGEHVNFKLKLKVMAIREKLVLFVDQTGKKYLKRL